MEREALAALEKRVAALRLLTAEKSVLARSLAQPEPIRFHAEISTAILAFAVLVVFLLGRGVGIVAASGASCSALAEGEFASITFATNTYVVTLNTNGRLMRDAGPETLHPGRIERRVSPDEVRTLANRLVEGCFLAKQPPAVIGDALGVTLTLRTAARMVTYRHSDSRHVRMCGGDDDLIEIERAIVELAHGNELFEPHAPD